MTKGFFLRAATVSALVAFLVPFIYTVLFGYSVVYDPPMDPATFYGGDDQGYIDYPSLEEAETTEASPKQDIVNY